MGRLSKKPIIIPEGVTADITDNAVVIKGPKGELKRAFDLNFRIVKENGTITVSAPNIDTKENRALWGTIGAHLRNMIKGVTKSFSKELEISGVGFRAEVKGKNLVLQLGFSHPVELAIPDGLEVKIEKNTIKISGIDKEKLGLFAAQVRGQKKPEPYKGKGIKYSDEIVRRKAGKAVKGAEGAAS